MHKENKVFHIANGYWSSSLYRELVLGLDSLLEKQGVFVPTRAKNQEGINNIESESIKVYYKRIITSVFYRIFFNLKTRKAYNYIAKEIDVNQFDLIHAHSLFTDGAVALKLYEEFKIPYVVTVRNTDINTFFKYFFHLRKQGRAVLQHAEKVIFLSNTYKNRIHQYFPKEFKKELDSKSEIVHNGISKLWFENYPEDHSNQIGNSIKLLYVGEISANKNVINTLKAIRQLQVEGYNIEFTIVGKGKNDQARYLSRLQKLIERTPNIRLLDAISKAENLLKEYRKADIFIMNSHTETFGLVYAEALSQGLPVIYTKNEGFDNIFEAGEIGYPVDSKSIQKIKSGVELLIHNYHEIQPRCVKAAQRFNWELIARQLKGIYDESLAKG